MHKIFFLTKVIIIYLIVISFSLAAKSDFYQKGKNLFEKKEFDKSKIYFERDIVFNPKSEMSYLYLAKIFLDKEQDDDAEMKLNNVIVINPKNDEAIYLLTLLKIKQSNYDEAKELIEKFDLICDLFCVKKNEIQSKLNKIIPDNEKSNN